MAEALSFHCIVCYEVFDSEVNYPVILAGCGHTYVCVNCANRLTKCMECRTSLLYPLECDPAYHAALAAAEKEEKMRAAQSRKPRDRSVALPPSNPNQPIRVKPEDRMRLPTPKNLVLLSLMEATIGTLAASNSVDLAEQMENNTTNINSNSIPEDFEGKRIMAGVNIVTGGCGTYAVTSKTGVTVYPWKTTKAGSRQDATMTHQKENNFPPLLPAKKEQDSLVTSTHSQSLEHIFYSVTQLPSTNSIQPILKSWSFTEQQKQDGSLYHTTNKEEQNNNNLIRRSPFRLKFADRVQVVEMEADGWAKLARGNGYILAEHEHGSDLVKGMFYFNF